MKRWRSLTVKLLVAVSAVVVLLVLGSGGALVTGASGAGTGARDDDHACNLASLKGPYAYNVTGSVDTPTGTEVADIAAVGLAVSDGKGHITGHDWASTNGATTARTVSATYTVDPDCTGTAQIVFTPGGPAKVFFALADEGRVLKVISTDSGSVISGDAVHQ